MNKRQREARRRFKAKTTPEAITRRAELYATPKLEVESTTTSVASGGNNNIGFPLPGIGKTKQRVRRYEYNDQCDTVVGGNIAFFPFDPPRFHPSGEEMYRRIILTKDKEGNTVGHRCPNRAVAAKRDKYARTNKRCREHLAPVWDDDEWTSGILNRDVSPMEGEDGYVNLLAR